MCSCATLKEFQAELNSAVRKGRRLPLLPVCGRHRRGVLSDIQRPVAEQSPGTAGVTASPRDARSPCSLLKLQEPPPDRAAVRSDAAVSVDIISSRRDMHHKTVENLDLDAVSTYKVGSEGPLLLTAPVVLICSLNAENNAHPPEMSK